MIICSGLEIGIRSRDTKNGISLEENSPSEKVSVKY